MKNFNGSDWGSNGPKLLTRVYKNRCNSNQEVQDVPMICSNFAMLPKEKCYNVPWELWSLFFDESSSNQVMEMVKDSYFVHTWNDATWSTKIMTNSSAAFIQIARNSCPEVLKTSGDWF